QQTYGVNSHVIAYGGDHAIDCDAAPVDDLDLPENYALAIGRVEPENNAAMMLEAFASDSSRSLVAVGNWQRTKYGRSLVRRYAGNPQIRLLEPIYDLGRLKALRAGARLYVHGHSAGGTNPSLVEAMQFGIPVFAYDCVFNRSSTEERALFFRTSTELRALLDKVDEATLAQVANDMQAIARRRYTWSAVADQYYALLDRV
ncbi:MAG: glycosyltransferase, partial [Gammaproteobacteria bacterium]|nr:glycosyltransferase [Gammaproteobacteria bacterium]